MERLPVCQRCVDNNKQRLSSRVFDESDKNLTGEVVSSSWSYMAAHGINLHCWSAGGRHASIYLHVSVEWTNETVQCRELHVIQWSFKKFETKRILHSVKPARFLCVNCHHVFQWHGDSLFGDVLYFLCFHPIFCMLAESILSKNTTILTYIYIYFLNLLLLLFYDLLRHPSKCALKGFKETTELLMPPTKHLEYEPLEKQDKAKGWEI